MQEVVIQMLPQPHALAFFVFFQTSAGVANGERKNDATLCRLGFSVFFCVGQFIFRIRQSGEVCVVMIKEGFACQCFFGETMQFARVRCQKSQTRAPQHGPKAGNTKCTTKSGLLIIRFLKQEGPLYLFLKPTNQVFSPFVAVGDPLVHVLIDTLNPFGQTRSGARQQMQGASLRWIASRLGKRGDVLEPSRTKHSKWIEEIQKGGSWRVLFV